MNSIKQRSLLNQGPLGHGLPDASRLWIFLDVVYDISQRQPGKIHANAPPINAEEIPPAYQHEPPAYQRDRRDTRHVPDSTIIKNFLIFRIPNISLR
jgi:hypothetical protein